MDSTVSLWIPPWEDREKNKAFYKNREEWSKTHVRLFQQRLDEISGSADALTLDILKKRLEIQLAIEDLTLKSRSAGHPFWVIYGPLGVPLAVALLGFLAGYFSGKHC